MSNCPESIRLYMICKGTEFSAWPVAGGIYDQHPKLIEQWEAIMAAEGQEQKRQQAIDERKRKNQMGKAQAGRRRR